MINHLTPTVSSPRSACVPMNAEGKKCELPAPVGDCYEKQSPNDAPSMKGDRARMMNGKLRQKRSDTKAGTLARTYREFARMPYDMLLGTCRSHFEVIGLTALRKAIRNTTI